VTILANGGVNADPPRLYFRKHLEQHTARAVDLVWFLDQSVPKFAGSAEVRLAVEELIDRLAFFLGLAPTRDDDSEYGVWSSPDGAYLVVMAVDAARAVPSVSAGLHARDQLLASIAVASEEQLTCLQVICGKANDRLLNEAVHLRRASRHVRFITVDALMRLAGLVETGTMTTDQAVGVLRPPGALADQVIALLSPPLWR
jgi:hypothetical protein